VGALRELGYLIYGWLVDVSAEPGFVSGLLIGVAGFALVAFVLFRVRVWWGGVTQAFKPQTVIHKTDRSPAQVVGSSCSSFLVGVIVFLCVLFFLIGIIRPEALPKVLEFLGR
jgi:hypothetical protein